jgi:putative hydrolase of the HAD superfamily
MVACQMLRAAIFDLDDTIFDHSTVMQASLEHVSCVHNLPHGFVPAFLVANKAMWADYERGKLSRDEIRYGRMGAALAEIGRPDLDAKTLMEEYFAHYSSQQRLFPGALDCLRKLGCIIKLGIITNGFVDVQKKKLEKTGLAELVDAVLISEETGRIKPHPDVFRMALEQLGITPEEALYIGDSYASDIVGAESAGIRTIWFNPKGLISTGDYHGEVVADWRTLEQNLLLKINGGCNG